MVWDCTKINLLQRSECLGHRWMQVQMQRTLLGARGGTLAALSRVAAVLAVILVPLVLVLVVLLPLLSILKGKKMNWN